MHQPRLILGEGQGAIVAAAYAKPGFLEQAFATRNVQPAELPELSRAWGNVAAVLIHEPRLSKKSVQLEKLRQAASEMFEDYPVEPRRLLSWKDEKVIHYNETKEFLEAAKVEVLSQFGSLPLAQLLSEPPTLMWEHQGRCPCGRRCYLFGQCSKCLKEEQEGLKETVDLAPEAAGDEDELFFDNVQTGLLHRCDLPNKDPGRGPGGAFRGERLRGPMSLESGLV